MIFSRYPNLNQVKSIEPVVYHFAALAKEQTNAEVAFHLSDFCACLTQVAQGFGDAAIVVAKGLGRYIHDNPEDAIACIVELLIHFKAPSIVKLKQVQSIVSVIREQQLFARTVQCSSSVANKLTTPIKAMVADAQAVIETGLQRGKTAMHNLIKVAEAEPEIASTGDIAALKVPDRCFGDAEKLAKEVGVLLEERTIEAFEKSLSTIPSYDTADNIALYPKLKEDLAIRQVTSVTNTTKHGVERLIERGFTPDEIIALKNTPDFVMVQKDGAKVLVKKFNEKYSIIVEGDRGVITSLKNISENSFNRLAKNYSWER